MEGGSDTASMLTDLFTLDSKALCRCIAGILLLSVGVGVDLVFRGIVDYSKIKPAILPKGLVRIQI